MKKITFTLLAGVGASFLVLPALAQTPDVSASNSPAPTAFPAATPAPSPSATVAIPAASPIGSATTAAASPPNAFADNIARRAHGGKSKRGFYIDLDENVRGHSSGGSHDDIPAAVIPIVMFTMLAVFATPVAIVLVIMLVSWAKNRSLHRTITDIVAKGQPVPPELLRSRAGTPLRPWYDLRRGIVLLSVGTGVLLFFGIATGWDSGVWAFGLIPALIGLGYILAWRLAQKQENGFKL